MSGLDGRRVYLDWNASAPLRPEARAAMLEAMDTVGNPSSVHAEGRAARKIVERARAQVAYLTLCEPSEIVFTSGATESANAVMAQGWDEVVISPFEHDAVLQAATALPGGRIMSSKLFCDYGQGAMVGPNRRQSLMAVSAACGETGRESPYQVFFDLAKEDHACRTLVDVTQKAGKGCFNFSEEPGTAMADYAILSAHKLGGPKGIGALLIREGAPFDGTIRGGGQESGRRSGTENVIGIAGFGAAAACALSDEWDMVEKLRNILEETLVRAAPETIFFGQESPRLRNTSCFAVPGWRGETQVMALDLAGFAVSAGSACSSGKVAKASRVLRAMGFDDETASSAIRVSMGPTTTEAEVMAFAHTWIELHRRRRAQAA